jgi:hypothetical protein
LFGSQNNINIGNEIQFIKRTPLSTYLALEEFIRMLNDIRIGSGDPREEIAYLLIKLLRGKQPFERVRTVGEFRDLMNVLTDRDFYETTTKDRQEKYIHLMLRYLESRLPAEFTRFREAFDPDLLLDPIFLDTPELISQLTKKIMQRLAGDSTTDAPPPKKK